MDDRSQPTFSVIIPTYRRPEFLAHCLEAITALDYPSTSFEVLVVDDGSNTTPEALVKNFASRLRINLLIQPHSGPAVARNTGARSACGEFLAFTDDDCMPTRTWLRALASRLQQAPGCAVGGRVINALTENPYSSASQMLIDYLYSFLNATPQAATFFTSNNLCVSAAKFRAVGGFDESFRFSAEDRDFCDRWLRAGNQLVYEAEAAVYHRHWLTFEKFCRQHFDYGRGAPHFRKVRFERSGTKNQIDPLSFYRGLMRYPFTQIDGFRAIHQVALLVMSQATYAAGVFWEKIVGEMRVG